MTAPDTQVADRLLALFEGDIGEPEARLLAAQVADDPDARAMLDEWQAQNDQLATLYPLEGAGLVPVRLTRVVEAARRDTPGLRSRQIRQVAAALCLLAIGAIGGWAGRMATAPSAQTEALHLAALSAHLAYVGEVKHPVEVLAADRVQLNTWMTKRLGREMTPPDLTALGFALLGGRILPSAAGTAGLYMYESSDGRRVTLYILPQGSGGTPGMRYAQDGNIQSYSWVEETLSCAVVGDIAKEALRGLALSAYDQLI